MIEKLRDAFIKKFSEKIHSVEYNEKENFYVIRISHPKNYTQLVIWFNGQITSVGFTTYWHTHPDLFNLNSEEEIIDKTVNLVDDIINNKYLIAFSSKYGEWITDDVESDLKYKDDDETLEFGYWETVLLDWKKPINFNKID